MNLGSTIFFRKLSFFGFSWLLAILGYFAVELFVLPLDYFNFRVWEAVSVHQLTSYFPGPFYPHVHLSRTEVGDMGHGTKWAMPRKAEWWTDGFGFRNGPAIAPDYPVVVVGDSFAAGSGLTQSDTLSSQLASWLSRDVYSYAPVDMDQFLEDERFQLRPPKVVLFVVSERLLRKLIVTKVKDRQGSGFRGWVRAHSELVPVLVDLDRVSKLSDLNYLVSRLDHRGRLDGNIWPTEQLLLLRENFKPPYSNEGEALQIAQKVMAYQEVLRKRGVGLVFAVIPNKESVYYELTPDPRKTLYIPHLLGILRRAGIESVDLQEAFIRYSEKNKRFVYFRDDTHWNRWGVQIAADLLAPLVQKAAPSEFLIKGSPR